MPLRTIIIKATRSGTASTVIIRRGASGTGTGGTGDHGELDGLGDDDHTQYLNNARGDARYPLGSGTSTGTNTGDQDLSSYATTSALAGKASLAATNNFTATQAFAQPVYLSGAVMGVVTTPIAGAYNGPGTGLTGTAQDLIVGHAFTANALTSVLPITSGGTGGSGSSTLGAFRTELGIKTFTARALLYDESGVTNTTFVKAVGLSLPVDANSVYKLDLCLFYTSNGGHIKFEVRTPSAKLAYNQTNSGLTVTPGGVVGVARASSGTVHSVSAFSGGTAGASVMASVFIDVGTTGGNLEIWWAQQTPSANATVLKAMSCVTITPLQ